MAIKKNLGTFFFLTIKSVTAVVVVDVVVVVAAAVAVVEVTAEATTFAGLGL